MFTLLGLIACVAPSEKRTPPVETGEPDSPAETAQESGTPEDSDSTVEETGDSEPTGVCSFDWKFGNSSGQRITVTVPDSSVVERVLFNHAELYLMEVESPTTVIGFVPLNPAGVVQVTVFDSATTWIVCDGEFEYWTPLQIPNVVADLVPFTWGQLSKDTEPVLMQFAGRYVGEPSFRALDTTLSPFADENGLPAFTGASVFETSPPLVLPNGSSIFAIAAWTHDDTTTEGSAHNVPMTILGDRTSAYGAFGISGGQVASNHYVGGPVLVTGGEGLNDGVTRLIGATYDGETTTAIYVGNQQQGVDAISAPLIGDNSFDSIGAGYPQADAFVGSLGVVIVVDGVIARDDLIKLDLWAQQQFGTPTSPELDPWVRERAGDMPEDWYVRDGAQMVQLSSGRVLALGGWSPYDPWGSRTTNEVWASDDDGATWQLLLAHDPDAPTEGVGARFAPGHTVGVTTWNGHAVVIGTDPNQPPYTGDVWLESDEGLTWTRVSTSAPSVDRCLFMVANLDDNLYLMGGQTNIYMRETAISDVWRSEDGGVTWTELDPPPWSGRGMNFRPSVVDGRLIVVSGGNYDDTEPDAFNGVYAFDGTTWETVLPDGHTLFEASYYNASAALNGRLWVFNGYTGSAELSRALFSDDGGYTWGTVPSGSGGGTSHADAVVALSDRILRVSGSLNERGIWWWRAP